MSVTSVTGDKPVEINEKGQVWLGIDFVWLVESGFVRGTFMCNWFDCKTVGDMYHTIRKELKWKSISRMDIFCGTNIKRCNSGAFNMKDMTQLYTNHNKLKLYKNTTPITELKSSNLLVICYEDGLCPCYVSRYTSFSQRLTLSEQKQIIDDLESFAFFDSLTKKSGHDNQALTLYIESAKHYKKICGSHIDNLLLPPIPYHLC